MPLNPEIVQYLQRIDGAEVLNHELNAWLSKNILHE